MEYTKKTHMEIHKTIFGNYPEHSTGMSAVGTYTGMLHEINLNYAHKKEEMSKKLNELIMPYYEDIKANPTKVL